MPTAKTEGAMPVGKLLAKIFSNSLARIVNYSGSGSVKIKLRDTNIFTAIQCKFQMSYIYMYISNLVFSNILEIETLINYFQVLLLKSFRHVILHMFSQKFHVSSVQATKEK